MVVSFSVSAKETKLRCPAVQEESENPKELASELFDAGVEAFKKKRYKISFRKFMCSLLLENHINTVYNIAQVMPFLRNKKRILKQLHRYVEEHDDNWTTKEVKKIIITLERELKKQPSWNPDSILHDDAD